MCRAFLIVLEHEILSHFRLFYSPNLPYAYAINDLESEMNWFIKAIMNTWDFSGRACRQEFWYFQLVWSLIGGGAVFADYKLGLVFEEALFGPFGAIIGIMFFVTSISLVVRRLHDSNLPGWWALVILLPLGNIIVMILAIRASDPSENKYGPPTTGYAPGEEVERNHTDDIGRFDA